MRNTGTAPVDLIISRPIAGCFSRGWGKRDICGYKVCVSVIRPNIGRSVELLWLTNGFSQIGFPNARECRPDFENWRGSPAVELPRFCDFQKGHPDCAVGRVENYDADLGTPQGNGSQNSSSPVPATPYVKGDLGNWTVKPELDPMTDALKCVGKLKDAPSVELSADNLYVQVEGGIQSITLRFDNDSAEPLRLPSQIEKDIGAVIIDAPYFSRAIASTRLRYQVLTLVRGLKNGDLDLAGISAAHDAIVNCASFTEVNETPKSSCDTKLREAMSKKGLSANDIIEVCGK